MSKALCSGNIFSGPFFDKVGLYIALCQILGGYVSHTGSNGDCSGYGGHCGGSGSGYGLGYIKCYFTQFAPTFGRPVVFLFFDGFGHALGARAALGDVVVAPDFGLFGGSSLVVLLLHGIQSAYFFRVFQDGRFIFGGSFAGFDAVLTFGNASAQRFYGAVYLLHVAPAQFGILVERLQAVPDFVFVIYVFQEASITVAVIVFPLVERLLETFPECRNGLRLGRYTVRLDVL